MQVEVDVPYAESQAARPTVEALMWPGRTVMDLVSNALLHKLHTNSWIST